MKDANQVGTEAGECLFFILSLKWTRRPDQLATWWRPDNQGYCWDLRQAGRYTKVEVREHVDYYNSGCATVAIPCEVVERCAAEHVIANEPRPYFGVKRHLPTLYRLIRSAPLPFARPQHAEAPWRRVVLRAHVERVGALSHVTPLESDR